MKDEVDLTDLRVFFFLIIPPFFLMSKKCAGQFYKAQIKISIYKKKFRWTSNATFNLIKLPLFLVNNISRIFLFQFAHSNLPAEYSWMTRSSRILIVNYNLPAEYSWMTRSSRILIVNSNLPAEYSWMARSSRILKS